MVRSEMGKLGRMIRRRRQYSRRYWLWWGIAVGPILGASIYLTGDEEFSLVTFVGTILLFLVAMVAAGQVIYWMITPTDQGE